MLHVFQTMANWAVKQSDSARGLSYFETSNESTCQAKNILTLWLDTVSPIGKCKQVIKKKIKTWFFIPNPKYQDFISSIWTLYV